MEKAEACRETSRVSHSGESGEDAGAVGHDTPQANSS